MAKSSPHRDVEPIRTISVCARLHADHLLILVGVRKLQLLAGTLVLPVPIVPRPREKNEELQVATLVERDVVVATVGV